MHRRSLPPATLGLALVIGAASSADAAGYYLGDVGTRGLARGGAFVAAPDSLHAVHYNPAALSLLKGLHIEVDGSLADYSYSFDRTCPCVDPSVAGAADFDAKLDDGFKSVSNGAGIQALPYLAIGYGFDFLDLTVAFAAYAPHAPPAFSFGKTEQPFANWVASRYTVIEMELFEAYAELGFGLSPIKGLRVGGSLQFFAFGVKQNLHLWGNADTAVTLDRPENTDFDIPAELEFRKDGMLNWSLGVSYDLLRNLQIGASVLGRRSVRAEGTAKITVPELLVSVASITGNSVEVEANLPPVYRVGAQYVIPGVAKIEAAAVVEAWSSYSTVKIRGKDIIVELAGVQTPLAPINFSFGFKNTFSLRLGGELDVFQPYLGLRAGYFYEPSAIPPQSKDPSTPDQNKHGLSIGGSTSWYGLTLELAVQYILLETLTVTDSAQRLVGPIEGPGLDKHNTALGNGTYSGSMVYFSAGLSAAFDEILGTDE